MSTDTSEDQKDLKKPLNLLGDGPLDISMSSDFELNVPVLKQKLDSSN